MAVPTALVDDVVAAAGGQQYYVDGITQLTMADFVTTGSYDKHIRRMRAAYRRRRDLLVSRLAALAPAVTVTGLSAGLHVLLLLPDGAEPELVRRAGQAGVGIAGLSRLRHPLAGNDVPRPDGVVVNFGTPGEHAFPAAVEALCDVVTSTLR
jgi:GntR family transcriptional regulator/MocR family aminotransferase